MEKRILIMRKVTVTTTLSQRPEEINTYIKTSFLYPQPLLPF